MKAPIRRSALALVLLALGLVVTTPAAAAPSRGNCGCAPTDLMCLMRCSAG